jgi:hypothetical protein
VRRQKTLAKVPFLAPDVSTKVIPAPVDGWDAISPLAEMDPKRAPILDNWVCRPGFVELRSGYQAFAGTGSTHAVESLIVWRGPAGEKMFAAAGNSIYDVSISGPASAVVTGLISARWQYVNFTPAGAATVVQLVDGVDPLQQYNGTTWSAPSITGLPGGLTTSSIINIASDKRRLWYVLTASSIVAFMPTDAITGPIAGTLDLGALWTKGGYLMAMTSWTIDGGTGPQDYACFISSRGQVSIYSGTDPTNAAVWALVGTFDISPPIGRRCTVRLGSDVGIITQQGVIPISQALPFDPSADRSVAITARIQNAMVLASQTSMGNFGWEMLTYPTQQLAILNVPLTENTTQVQYISNSLTGAWSRITGWNANTFAIYKDTLYWGGNTGVVNTGWVGQTDGGTSIPADMQAAFNWMDEPGKVKRMTMIQPLLGIGVNIAPLLSVDTDFQTSTAVAPIISIQGGSLWDKAIWDVSLWSTLQINFISFLSVSAIGHAMAIRMRYNIQDPVAAGGIAGVFDTGVFDTAQFDSNFSTSSPVLQIFSFNTVSEAGGAL